MSGPGRVGLAARQSATFWVYAAGDGEHTLHIDNAGGGGRATLAVNGQQVADVKKSSAVRVFLSGGVNKVTVTGKSGNVYLDRLRVEATSGTLRTAWYEAEAGTLAGTAAVSGAAVTGVGGAPGNANTLTLDVRAKAAGTYAMTVRYSNPEQSPASHYNPDPLARPADISVNGGAERRTLFPHTFHANNFWYLTIPVTLKAGHNTIRFSSEELPDFGGTTYISDRYTEPLRSRYAPNIDKVGITPYAS